MCIYTYIYIYTYANVNVISLILNIEVSQYKLIILHCLFGKLDEVLNH